MEEQSERGKKHFQQRIRKKAEVSKQKMQLMSEVQSDLRMWFNILGRHPDVVLDEENEVFLQLEQCQLLGIRLS